MIMWQRKTEGLHTWQPENKCWSPLTLHWSLTCSLHDMEQIFNLQLSRCCSISTYGTTRTSVGAPWSHVKASCCAPYRTQNKLQLSTWQRFLNSSYRLLSKGNNQDNMNRDTQNIPSTQKAPVQHPYYTYNMYQIPFHGTQVTNSKSQRPTFN